VPLDVILIIDHSGSMRFPLWGGKLTYAKLAASALIDELAVDKDRVGVVQFGTAAELVHPISFRYADVNRAIAFRYHNP